MQMLINQYIQEVLRYVPMAQRQELEREIEATIEEQLLMGYGEKEYNIEEISQVLESMGAPIDVAKDYTGSSYELIAATVVPVYVRLMKWAIGIGVLAVLLRHVVTDMLLSNMEIPSVIGAVLGDSWMVVMTIFTLVTLVFFILSKEDMTDVMRKEWTIDQLAKVVDIRDRIPLSVGISSFIGYLVTFIWLGAIQKIFTDVFHMEHSSRVIGLLAIGLLVGMLLSVHQMITKAWTKKSRLIDMGITLWFAGVIGTVLVSHVVIDWNAYKAMVDPQYSWMLISKVRIMAGVALGVSVMLSAIRHGRRILNH